MPKPKKHDKHLPMRMYVDRGKQRKDGSWPAPTFFIRPPKGKRIQLGNNEPDALRKWVEVIGRPKNVEVMNHLMDRFVVEELSKIKKQKNYKNTLQQLKPLRLYFGEMFPDEVESADIYDYMEERAPKRIVKKIINGKEREITVGGQVTANREKSLLSKIFKFGIRKRLCKNNPCRGVERFTEIPRTRYPKNWEFDAVYDEGSDMLQCMMDFAYITDQRIGDILEVNETENFNDEGIEVTQNKSEGGKHILVKILIKWDNDLRACVTRARKLRSNIRSMYLFCKNDGQSYTYDGFKSMFRRAMEKAIKKGKLYEKYTFHDIRAKSYSDETDTESKMKRAGHQSMQMRKVYDRKPVKVEPKKKWERS